MMPANRPQVCNYKIRNRDDRRPWSWPLRGLALLLLGALGHARAEAQALAYVPTHKSNTVSVVNTATNTVVATVPVGIQPLAVAITPDGAFAYVTNSGWIFGSDSDSVINTHTNTVTDRIIVVAVAIDVDVAPNGACDDVVDDGAINVSVNNTATTT